MAIAWLIVRGRSTPIVAEQFHTPATSPIDARLLGGAALFGIGWALSACAPAPPSPRSRSSLPPRCSSPLQWRSAQPSTASHSSHAVRRDRTGDIHGLQEDHTVLLGCSQLTRDDVAAAAQAGFRSIVSSRPNGEEQGQPSAHEMARIAEEHGLAFAHVPIVPGKATDADADRMKEALTALPGPTLGFCRSGTRALPYGRWRRRVMPIPKRSSVRPRQPGTTWPI